MTSNWKEKKKAKKMQALAIQRQEEEKERLQKEHELAVTKGKEERERIRRYNRAYRKAHLAETADRQRRWRAKKHALSLNQ